jgi:hypothetical protein
MMVGMVGIDGGRGGSQNVRDVWDGRDGVVEVAGLCDTCGCIRLSEWARPRVIYGLSPFIYGIA